MRLYPVGLCRPKRCCYDRHLRGNRIADQAAKECAVRSAAIHFDLFPQLEREIFQKQAQLVQLNKLIGSEEYETRRWNPGPSPFSLCELIVFVFLRP